MFKPVDAEQQQLLDLYEILGVAASSVTVRPLSGGVLSRSYRLSSASGDWVARLPTNAENRFRLELSVEQRLLENLSELGLTAPIVSRETGDILVTQFLATASTWTAADARDPKNIVRIASKLRELHGINHDLPPFSATLIAEDYCQMVLERHRLVPEQREWMEQFLELASAYDAVSAPATLCHYDLVAENIMDDGGLWFIDFEYAICAEPLLDLASLASMNNYGSMEQKCLLHAYYEGAAPRFSMTRFSSVIRLLRLQTYFWALSSYDPEKEDEPFTRFVENMSAVLR